MNGNTHPLGRDLVLRGDKETTGIGKIIGITQQLDAEGRATTTYQLRCSGSMPIDVPAECVIGPTTDVERHLIEVGETITYDPFREASGLRHLIGVLGSSDAARSIAAHAETVRGALRVLLGEILRTRLIAAGEEVSRETLLCDPNRNRDLGDQIPF